MKSIFIDNYEVEQFGDYVSVCWNLKLNKVIVDNTEVIVKSRIGSPLISFVAAQAVLEELTQALEYLKGK